MCECECVCVCAPLNEQLHKPHVPKPDPNAAKTPQELPNLPESKSPQRKTNPKTPQQPSLPNSKVIEEALDSTLGIMLAQSGIPGEIVGSYTSLSDIVKSKAKSWAQLSQNTASAPKAAKCGEVKAQLQASHGTLANIRITIRRICPGLTRGFRQWGLFVTRYRSWRRRLRLNRRKLRSSPNCTRSCCCSRSLKIRITWRMLSLASLLSQLHRRWRRLRLASQQGIQQYCQRA